MVDGPECWGRGCVSRPLSGGGVGIAVCLCYACTGDGSLLTILISALDQGQLSQLQ